MLTNEQKREFIKTICKKYLDESKNKEFQIVRKEKLLEDTKNGKMYKYRTFNSYSLSNLIDGTLYCAAPSSFNDPFDCKMGLDYTSLTNDIFNYDLNDIEKYIYRFIKSYLEENLSDIENEKEKLIFCKWNQNKKICEFIRCNCKIGMSKKEIDTKLCTKLDIIFEFIKDCITDKVSIELINMFIDKIKSLGSVDLMNFVSEDELSVTKVLEYLSINEDLDEIGKVEEFCQIYQPEELENAKMLNDIFMNASKEISRLSDSLFRIGSLSTDYTNRLMWSHYADKHQGFCVEYDFNQDMDVIKDLLCLPVTYAKERVKVPWKAALSNNKDNPIIQLEAVEKILLSLLVKDEIWNYENEWRVILSNSGGIENVKMPPITCIYLGALCKEQDKKIIMKIAKELKIPVKQMVIDRGEYELHVKDCIWE